MQPHLGGRGPASLDRDAAASRSEIVRVGDAAHARVVLALDLVARVHQARGELAVVGEQQQAFRVVVEAADRVHVLPHAAQQVEDRRPSLRIGRVVT